MQTSRRHLFPLQAKPFLFLSLNILDLNFFDSAISRIFDRVATKSGTVRDSFQSVTRLLAPNAYSNRLARSLATMHSEIAPPSPRTTILWAMPSVKFSLSDQDGSSVVLWRMVSFYAKALRVLLLEINTLPKSFSLLTHLFRTYYLPTNGHPSKIYVSDTRRQY